MAKKAPGPVNFMTRWSPEDLTLLHKLTADSSAASGHPITVMAILRQLVRDAAQRGRPIKPEEKTR
jgi:hypothetical protein